MNSGKKISLLFFFLFVLFSTSLLYVLGIDFLSKQSKPWQLQHSVHEDSLSSEMKREYQVVDKASLLNHFRDSSRVTVLVLVDSWGVSNDERKLREDFAIFNDVPHKYYIHQRMANRTKHAENVEYRHDDSVGVFLFGGDSLEYGRKEYIPLLGYSCLLFWQNSTDSFMIAKLDSLIQESRFRVYAWTTQDSRFGNRDKLHNTLQGLSGLAQKYPDIHFIVQGLHRPILGSPETRRAYKSHWVPAAILNP